ncbi:Uma2 family endonuclease [Thermodesulfobacteriota bacterium]
MQLSNEKKAWTESRLMSLPDVGGKHELVEGELVVTPTNFGHEIIGSCLIMELRLFVKQNKLGHVGGSSLGCWISNGNVRSPDVSFVSTKRLKELGQDMRGFLKGAPDLAVEIISPSNTVNDMREKAVEYFESGSKLVWIVSPDDETVVVLRPSGSERVLNVTDSLDGEDVIPGFSLVVSELFEDLELA